MFKGALFAQIMQLSFGGHTAALPEESISNPRRNMSQNPDPTLESWDEWYTFEHIQQPLQRYHGG